MKNKLLILTLTILLTGVFYLAWQKHGSMPAEDKADLVERYGVIQTSSTSGELRMSYYDMEQGKTLDSWEGYPWFFATLENIEDREGGKAQYDYVQSNKGSIFKIVGKKDTDDCDYYGDGVCLESIIVEGIEVVGKVDESSTEEIVFSDEQLKNYYAVYADPFVLHIRKALNGYLDGTNEGMEIPDAAIEKHETGDGSLAGLASFERDYYKSKFVVMALEDALMGGKTATIIFQDKPDKVFTAWVYRLGEEQYDFRGFWENETATEGLDKQRKTLGKYIFDKEHSL